jgi:hypothetical protein
MSEKTENSIVPVVLIQNRIYELRGEKVMFDFDLAELYGVETYQLKRAIRRHPDRFPPDFMFELTNEELNILSCQIGSSSWGGSRYAPMAFTEQGVAMLSSVLNSERAVNVNVTIMRAFVAVRKMIASHADLVRKIDDMEKKYDSHFARLVSLPNQWFLRQ